MCSGGNSGVIAGAGEAGLGAILTATGAGSGLGVPLILGGLGSAVLEFMSENGYSAKIKRLGVPDRFIEHGTLRELYHECGYDTEGICAAIKSMVSGT